MSNINQVHTQILIPSLCFHITCFRFKIIKWAKKKFVINFTWRFVHLTFSLLFSLLGSSSHTSSPKKTPFGIPPWTKSVLRTWTTLCLTTGSPLRTTRKNNRTEGILCWQFWSADYNHVLGMMKSGIFLYYNKALNWLHTSDKNVSTMCPRIRFV